MNFHNKEILSEIGRNFIIQPIVCAKTHRIQAIELLSKWKLDFSNRAIMLKMDIFALHSAFTLAKALELSVHCNAEVYSMTHYAWLDLVRMSDLENVVVEITERNNILADERFFKRAAHSVVEIRNNGGKIALDDLTMTDIEMREIKVFAPEIVKFEIDEWTANRIPMTGVKTVVERIETIEDALKARSVDLIQGYWCDAISSSSLPLNVDTPASFVKKPRSLIRQFVI